MKPILPDVREKFETKQLLISIYVNGDGAEFFQLIQSNFSHLQEELREIHTIKSIEDVEEYVRYKKVAWIARERFVPKIIDKVTGRMIGQLWIEPKWDRMMFELGDFLKKQARGRDVFPKPLTK